MAVNYINTFFEKAAEKVQLKKKTINPTFSKKAIGLPKQKAQRPEQYSHTPTLL